MDLSNKPPLMRMLCAEPLEGRWLLSAAPQSTSSNTPSPVVSVVEPFTEEEEDDGEDQEIAEADLPPAVLAAFRAQFSTAEIETVEREQEEEGVEYGIEAIKEGGQRIDVTLSPEGEILETESFIDSDQAPQAAKDLARDQFGGTIKEVASLGGDLYEVSATDADGREYEAVLRWTQPQQPTTPAIEGPAEPTPPAVAPAPPAAFADGFAPSTSSLSGAGDPVVEVAPAEPSEARQVAQAGADATADAERQRREDAIEKSAAAKAAAPATLPHADRVAQALDALAAGAGAGAWVPDVAGALIDVLPINVDGIEQRMQDVLRQFATMGGNAKPGSALTTGASRIAMAATIVAAVKMLLNHSKKPTAAGGTLVFGPSRSSWGWVLGTTSRNRRRVRSTEPRTP